MGGDEMTPAVLEFVRSHRDKLQGRVLEIGSLNVNGSVRSVVEVSVGVDIRKGTGVDLVCSVSDLPALFPAESFDSCVSTETLEHVEDWKSFVRVTWDMVKEGGWLVFTMASQYKGKHDHPADYWRFDNEQLRAVYPTAEPVPLGKDKKPTSVGWVVQKTGELGDLSIEPHRVK